MAVAAPSKPKSVKAPQVKDQPLFIGGKWRRQRVRQDASPPSTRPPARPSARSPRRTRPTSTWPSRPPARPSNPAPGGRWTPPTAAGCCSSWPTWSRRTPRNWPRSNRSTAARRSPTRSGDMQGVVNTLRYYAGWADKIEGRTVPVRGNFLSLHAAAAGRRRRPDHSLELPAADAGLEVGPGPGLRQHHRHEAGRADAADRACASPSWPWKPAFPTASSTSSTAIGETAGAALVAHPDVDKIAFTGHVDTAKIIQKAAADTLKRTHLRAGRQEPQRHLRRRRPGRGRRRRLPRHLLPRRPVLHRRQPAVRRGEDPRASSSNAWPRRPRAARSATRSIPTTEQGPQVSQEQIDKILGYVELGKKQGAKLVTGGKRVGAKGYFVEPTIFDNVKDDMAIAKDEIFGPVVSVLPFKEHRRSDRPGQQHQLRPGRRGLDQGHRQGPPVRQARSRPARSGSTATTSSTRRRRSAASRCPARAAKTARRRWSTTPR